MCLGFSKMDGWCGCHGMGPNTRPHGLWGGGFTVQWCGGWSHGVLFGERFFSECLGYPPGCALCGCWWATRYFGDSPEGLNSLFLYVSTAGDNRYDHNCYHCIPLRVLLAPLPLVTSTTGTTRTCTTTPTIVMLRLLVLPIPTTTITTTSCCREPQVQNAVTCTHHFHAKDFACLYCNLEAGTFMWQFAC